MRPWFSAQPVERPGQPVPLQLASASSFVPEECFQTLTPSELAIVVSVVQQVLDGKLPQGAIAEVCSPMLVPAGVQTVSCA